MRLSKKLEQACRKLAGEPEARPPAPPSKYHNRKAVRTIDGQPVWFDSTAEARRYDELWLMHQAGLIGPIRRQVVYDLVVGGQRICQYRADFVYFDFSQGRPVIEDVKGHRTEAFRLKAKLFAATQPHPITEIDAWAYRNANGAIRWPWPAGSGRRALPPPKPKRPGPKKSKARRRCASPGSAPARGRS
jgi:hypothetical protein